MKFIRETKKELTAEDTEITERKLVSHERESCAKLERVFSFLCVLCALCGEKRISVSGFSGLGG
jgi:hypothetical protein